MEGSTSIHYPDGSVASGEGADPATADGLTLVWELDEDLAAWSELIVTFRVAVASEYSRPLPDTRVNVAEAEGEWCPFESRACFELRPTSFDNVRIDHRTGTIKVRKKVKWRGQSPTRARRSPSACDRSAVEKSAARMWIGTAAPWSSAGCHRGSGRSTRRAWTRLPGR